MQAIHFETTVKNGYIKIPKKFSRLNNKKVIVGVFNKDISIEEKETRVRNVKEFLRKCSGILDNTQIPADVTIKQIREMRLNERHDL